MTDATPPRRFRLGGRRAQPMGYDPASTEGQERNAKIARDWVASRTFEEIIDPSMEAKRAVPGDKAANSILASATRLTGKTVASSSFRRTTREAWQDDAWSMFDLVGEFRFLMTTLAQRTAKARLYVGQVADNPSDAPIPTDDESKKAILDAMGDGHLGLSQLIERLTINMSVPGDGYLVGIPKELIEAHNAQLDNEAVSVTGARTGYTASQPPAPRALKPVDRTPGSNGDLDDTDYDSQTLDSLDWRMLSISEVQFMQRDEVRLRLGPTEEEIIDTSADEVYLIRVWNSHPRWWWAADSPTRASLPVLRELVGLTMHVSAQVDSRLAGAGVFFVPDGAARALKRSLGLPEDSPDDPFTEALMDSMLTPIGDRSNASAVVPLVVTAPDDTIEKFRLITFGQTLDQESRPMREESIRRLALGLNAPPELLLGTGGMNHWGAWLVAEETVNAHIEPPLQTICDAITTQYLRPVLIENGMSEEEAENWVIWYDVSDLIVRPNRGADAQKLFDQNVISAKANREANGFDESDAPADEINDPVIKAVFAMVTENPALMLRPGLDIVVAQMRALVAGNPMGAIDGASPEDASKAVPAGNVEDIENNPNGVEPISPPPVVAKPPTNSAEANGGPIPNTQGAPAPRIANAAAPMFFADDLQPLQVPVQRFAEDGLYEAIDPEPIGEYAIFDDEPVLPREHAYASATRSIHGLGLRGTLSRQLEGIEQTLTEKD